MKNIRYVLDLLVTPLWSVDRVESALPLTVRIVSGCMKSVRCSGP